jgi:hypothetical protein
LILKYHIRIFLSGKESKSSLCGKPNLVRFFFLAVPPGGWQSAATGSSGRLPNRTACPCPHFLGERENGLYFHRRRHRRRLVYQLGGAARWLAIRSNRFLRQVLVKQGSLPSVPRRKAT